MGRIKTAAIKRTSLMLVKQHEDQLFKTYEENKPAVSRFLKIQSKKMRNVIAGYVTRLMQAKGIKRIV